MSFFNNGVFEDIYYAPLDGGITMSDYIEYLRVDVSSNLVESIRRLFCLLMDDRNLSIRFCAKHKSALKRPASMLFGS